MTDNHTAEQRSRNMSAIRGTNTEPEKIVRAFLHKKGYRFRLHQKDLPGKPDIVLKKYRTIIEVRGCFWHRHPGCKYTTTPRSNKEYWESKFKTNIERDQKNFQKLLNMNWKVIIIWECELRHNEGKLDEIIQVLSEVE